MSPLSRHPLERTNPLEQLPRTLRALVVLFRECRARSESADSIAAASERSLNQWGIDRNDLDGLLNASYVARASAEDIGKRAFRSATCGPAFRDTQFVVTPAGVAFLEDIITALGLNRDVLAGNCSQESKIPHWEGQELRFLGVVVKRFKRPAPNQECLLDEFQKRRWVKFIENPLPFVEDTSPVDRLHDAVKRLNKSLDIPLLHFGGNGKGTGVCWRAVASPSNGHAPHSASIPALDGCCQ